MTPIDYFKDSFSLLDHSDLGYEQHCFGILKILQDLGCSEDVCLAGLYHSVYGTSNFNMPVTVDRSEIVSVIGVYAEKLVNIFCSLNNRTNTILNNTMDFSPKIRYDLICIEYANLKEQSNRQTDLNSACDLLLNEINIYQNFKSRVETVSMNDKKIYIIDNIMDQSSIEWINEFCTISKYTPEHRSNGLNYETDSRFTCNLNEEDIKNSGLLPYVWESVKLSGLKLDIVNAYINHYNIGTSVSKHCDSSVPGNYTMLVFCNKFWESVWGGEIAFYSDTTNSHAMFEFKPGRIIIFDARISHKVLPLTFAAKKDRYSIAIKCKER